MLNLHLVCQWIPFVHIVQVIRRNMEEKTRHKIQELCDRIWDVIAHIGDCIDDGEILDQHEIHSWLTNIVVSIDPPVVVE